jgi:hypothetical protein
VVAQVPQPLGPLPLTGQAFRWQLAEPGAQD